VVDLRTKLVFALVFVSLASMAVLGFLTYTNASELLTNKTLRQLDSLAETKKEDLQNVVHGWRAGVSLIASRTQLRINLREFTQTGAPARREGIGRILTDALRASEPLRSLTVYDLEGQVVSAVSRDSQFTPPEFDRAWIPVGDSIFFRETSIAPDDEPRVSFTAPLKIDARYVGVLLVVLEARELVAITQDTSGLGATGETVIVLEDSRGTLRVLHSMRLATGEPPAPEWLAERDEPAARALLGEQGPFTEGVIDYRGVPVWAATRYLPEVGWGVVVKFDEEEELEPIRDLRERITRLGLSLGAFAILIGTLLGIRITKPIHDLAGVANRIRLGELDARATVGREDELGLLAQTFNQMAEELEKQVTLLHEFQKYFEVSLDMLCIAGTDGYFKRVNPAFERELGWPTDRLLERPFYDLVHPDDVDATGKLGQGIPTVSFKNRFRCADGTYKELIWTAYPEPETGRLYAIARPVMEPQPPERA
jgi:PAS domain S-box-containing protein